MHSSESMRDIRALEYLFGSGNENDPWASPPAQTPRTYVNTGEVIAVARFNLKTREITIEPQGRDNSSAHQ